MSSLKQDIENIITYGVRKDIAFDKLADEIIAIIRTNINIKEVPESYSDPCNCADWTSDLRHNVWLHKPACPLFDPRYEMAVIQETTFRSLYQTALDSSEEN